ncbi:MAG: hypothetical protein ACFCUR_09755 [Rhodomicrobiaceae bacterium]
MNAVPGFEHRQDMPKTQWVTMIVIGLITTGLVAGVAIRLFGSIDWPGDGAGLHATAGPAVEDYTLFKILKIEGGEVHSGYSFARSGDPAPFRQYCYAQIYRDGSRITSQVDLAEKRPGEPVRYERLSAEDAASLGLSLEEARQLARRHCRFRDEGEW